MLFDFILILLLISFFFKTSAKASLDNFIWVLGTFITIRVSGMFYLSLAEIMRGLFSALDQINSQYIAYILMAFLVSFIYIFFLRQPIAKLSKYLPKKILVLINSVFTVLMGFMVFVIIYAIANSLPLINKLPPRVRNAKSEVFVVWTLGGGTVEFIKSMRRGLDEFNNPMDFLKDKNLLDKTSHKIKEAVDELDKQEDPKDKKSKISE